MNLDYWSDISELSSGVELSTYLFHMHIINYEWIIIPCIYQIKMLSEKVLKMFTTNLLVSPEATVHNLSQFLPLAQHGPWTVQ